MAVGTNKFTDEEKDWLNTIQDVIVQVEKSDPDKADAMFNELQGIVDNAKFFNNSKLRNIFIQKQFAKSNYFKDKDALQNVLNANKDKRTLSNAYWTPSSDADIKATNVSQIDSKGYNKDFFNWESDRHWTKLSPTEIKETADYMKMSPQDLLNEVRDEQTKRDREGLFSLKNDPWAFAASLAYPRTAEAIMRGEDPKAKDLVMDTAENGLYGFNPGGKVASVGERAGGKYAPKIMKLLGNATEPLISETADAFVYNDKDNTDRKNFNPMDVLIGTGTNLAMGKVFPDVKPTSKPEKKIVDTKQVETFEKTVNDAMDDKELKNIKNKMDMAEIAGNTKLLEQYNNEWTNRVNELNNKILKAEPNVRDRGLKDWIKYGATNMAPGGLNTISNKTGDVLSEDPRFQNRALRLLGGRMVAPYLIDLTKEARTEDEEERKKMYELLGR